MGLCALVFGGAGLAVFAIDVAAYLEGERTLTVRVKHQFHRTETIAIQLHALAFLALGIAGAAGVWAIAAMRWNGLDPACYDATTIRPWVRWSLGLVLLPLVLALILLAILAFTGHV